jgi:hypothetical protein
VTIRSNAAERREGGALSGELTVKVEPYGATQAAHDRVAKSLVARGGLDADHRLLALRLVEPERKTAKARPHERYHAVFYDYKRNHAVHAKGALVDPARAELAVTQRQPRPSPDEFQAAVAIVRRHKELGPAVRSGALRPYPPMPPLVETELPDGTVERTVAVGLLPSGTKKGPRHEIVGVNMVRRRIERYEAAAPATALATAGLCGVPLAADQPTTAQGVAGQAWVSVYQGRTLLWRFLAVRPSSSSGHSGSGVELRYVDYRGKRVLHQAHVPILNVRYEGDVCGPYRDWQYQEGMLQATGKKVAPGFILCSTPAKTIVETESDHGTFLGTAIYVDGQEAVLVCELEAGWYRYVSEWRLHADGTISPRFAFDAVSSSCVCNKHHHHVYWRLDFDIRTAADNRVVEFNDPPLGGTRKWQTLPYETMRLRSAQHKRRWRVEHTGSGAGYEIVPGPNDSTAAGDAYAVGDLWALRWRPGQIDDEPAPDTSIHLHPFNNHEPIDGQDVVLWYGAHFTHDVRGPEVSHVVGPTLVPHAW